MTANPLQHCDSGDAPERIRTSDLRFRSNGPRTPEGSNPQYFKAASEPKTLWEIPESKHTGGMAARPAEYERRVVGFFDDALLG